ncbi:interferon-induced protein 44-like isoform 2-T2 [Menidia menidia]
MGGNSSLYRNPWRVLPDHLRILLQGPVGAGKSSFINSVESVVCGRISGQVMTDAASGTSFTKRFKTCKISKYERGNEKCSFVFNDIMGFEGNNGGIHVEDVKLILNGHVEEGYEFKPGRPLKMGEAGYDCSPSLSKRTHVLVNVIPAASVSLSSEDVLKKMRDVRLEASKLEIPQFVILTKVDEACPEVKKDIKNIYKSICLKEQVDKIHQKLGIPLNCIFLVQNYFSSVETSNDINVQIMSAMKQMINFGEDFVTNQ